MQHIPEITLTTDFERIFLSASDGEELQALKNAIFQAVWELPEYLSARQRLKCPECGRREDVHS